MNIEEAKILIRKEYESDDGLDLLFRMSADVETERITTFITALKCLEEHYQNQQLIERELVYQLYTMGNTLKASMGHWKVSRPKGLDQDTCYEIFDTIRDIFSR